MLLPKVRIPIAWFFKIKRGRKLVKNHPWSSLLLEGYIGPSGSKLLCLLNSKQIVRALKRSKIVLFLGGNCFHILLSNAELLLVCTIRKVYSLTNTSLLPIAVLKTLFDWTYEVSGLLDQMVLKRR